MAIRPDPEGAEIRALRAVTGGFAGKRVLEVGCSSGRLTWRYADGAAYVLGLDTDADAITEASASMPETLRSRVEFRTLSVLDFEPPREALFDVAILSWTL